MLQAHKTREKKENRMIDLVKKTMLTGLGLASLTKEKVEEVAKAFVEKGKMTEQEGRALVDELLARSEESKEELKKQIEERVQAVLAKMDLAKQSEVDNLKQEVAALREEMTNKSE